jgi:translation elongation factor EF-G
MSKALQRFTKEDPTFRAGVDQESGETVIQGMGELQLDVYIERMRREYGVKVQVSPPQVAYRETFTQRADYNYTHKKQTGGSGQYGKIMGYIEPSPRVTSSSSTTWSAARCPASSSRPSRRASGRCSTRAVRSASRWSTSAVCSTTVVTTRSTRRTSRSRKRPAAPGVRPTTRPSPACSSRSCGSWSRAPRSSAATCSPPSCSVAAW